MLETDQKIHCACTATDLERDCCPLPHLNVFDSNLKLSNLLHSSLRFLKPLLILTLKAPRVLEQGVQAVHSVRLQSTGASDPVRHDAVSLRELKEHASAQEKSFAKTLNEDVHCTHACGLYAMYRVRSFIYNIFGTN